MRKLQFVFYLFIVFALVLSACSTGGSGGASSRR